jgi:hypothetical protein
MRSRRSFFYASVFSSLWKLRRFFHAVCSWHIVVSLLVSFSTAHTLLASCHPLHVPSLWCVNKLVHFWTYLG